jgi:hypothetical protein
MGIRLYVQAKFTEQPTEADCGEGNVPTPEEVLAGVMTGTSSRLDEFEKSQPRDCRLPTYYTDSDKWYETLMNDGELDALSNFRMFGYGKLNHQQYDYLTKVVGADPICGALTEPEQMETMLKLHGVTIPCCLQVTEVAWS